MMTVRIACVPRNVAITMLLVGAFLLSACGARTEEGASSQPIFNANGELISGGDGSTLALGAANPSEEMTLRVVSDVNSIATGGTEVANITALVTDANNNAVAFTPVSFRSTGGVLQNLSESTGENGEASATLRLLQDFQNQDIVVTVSAESYESTVRVEASGSSIEMTGPDNVISGDTATLVMRLLAGNGEPIANQAVTVTSVAGNSISPALLVTDSDGRAGVSIGTENYSDTVRISALDGSVSASHER